MFLICSEWTPHATVHIDPLPAWLVLSTDSLAILEIHAGKHHVSAASTGTTLVLTFRRKADGAVGDGPAAVFRFRVPKFDWQLIDLPGRRLRVVAWHGGFRAPIEYGTPIRPPHRFGELTLMQPTLPPADFDGKLRFRCSCGRAVEARWSAVERGHVACCRACAASTRGDQHVRHWRRVVRNGCAEIWHEYDVYRRDVPHGWRPIPRDRTRPLGPDNMLLAEYVGKLNATAAKTKKCDTPGVPTRQQLARITGYSYSTIRTEVLALGGSVLAWIGAHPEHAEAIAKWKADPDSYEYPPPRPGARQRKPLAAVPSMAVGRSKREQEIRRHLAAGLTVEEVVAATGASSAAVALIRTWMQTEKRLRLAATDPNTAADPNTGDA